MGINTTKLPQTPEEFEKVQESLRNPKSGISLEIKVDETNNAEKQVFNGTEWECEIRARARECVFCR